MRLGLQRIRLGFPEDVAGISRRGGGGGGRVARSG